MKLYAALFTILALFSSNLFADIPTTPVAPKEVPFNWTYFGFNLQGEQAYYNNGGIINIIDDGKHFMNMATVLVVLPNPVIMESPDGPEVVNSVISTVIVDCNGGEIRPIITMYFTEKFPKLDTMSVMTKKYTLDPPAEEYNPRSGIIQTLCPIPI